MILRTHHIKTLMFIILTLFFNACKTRKPASDVKFVTPSRSLSFDQNNFSHCVAELINTHMSKDDYQKRQQEIRKKTELYYKEVYRDKEDTNLIVEQIGRKYILSKAMADFAIQPTMSAPGLMCQSIFQAGFEFDNACALLPQFSKDYPWFTAYQENVSCYINLQSFCNSVPFTYLLLKLYDDSVSNLTNHSEEVMHRYRQYEDVFSISRYLNNMRQNEQSGSFSQRVYFFKFHELAQLASPMAYWLSQVPRRSLSLKKLFTQGMNIYGNDIFTVLAVLNFLFIEEKNDINGKRENQAILGTRLKELLIDDTIDPVGYNYHFIGFLSLALVSEGTTPFLGKAYSFVMEYLQDDHGDYAADYYGLEVAKEINALIGKKTDCRP